MRRLLTRTSSHLIVAGLLTLAASPALAQRADLLFNDGWRMATGDAQGAAAVEFDDAAWKPVTLPRAFNEDEAFARDIHEHSTGITWYRKRFVLPADKGPAVGGRA
ncbi:MAG: beta-galactosidase, partial [Caulobacter sp.]